MISTVKLFCVAIVYFIAISVSNLDKVADATAELENNIKEYVVGSCVTVAIKATYTIPLLNNNLQNYFPFKKEKLWQ